MSIQFTQYLMPKGERTTVSIERPREIETKANAMKVKNYKFDIEVLSNGHVSMTIENDDGPIAHRICVNGPLVPVNVDDMVNEAFDSLIKAGKL